MRRAFLGITAALTTSVLTGCPVYSDGGDYRVCTDWGCYQCPDRHYSEGECTPIACRSGGNCGYDWSCYPDGTCVSSSGASGTTGQSGAGGPPPLDASAVYDVSPGNVTADAGSVARGDSSASGSGDASDALSEAEASVRPVACNLDEDCGGAGALCIDGQCTPADQLCSATVGCAAPGYRCVQGRCAAPCSLDDPCLAGYGCDFTTGICDLNPTPCTSSLACQGAHVCVEGRCVGPCSEGDAGTCPANQICVGGGCLPDERSVGACTTSSVP